MMSRGAVDENGGLNARAWFGAAPPAGPRLLALVFPLLLVLWSAWAFAAPDAAAVQDLSGWRIDRDGPRVLTGPWDVWPMAFLDPDAIGRAQAPPAPARVTIPFLWSHKPIAGRVMPADGYVTFHTRLILPPGQPPLALKFGEASSAWRLFANGVEIAHEGVPGRAAAEEVPRGRITIVPLPDAPDLDLVIHMSNHLHFEGGARGAIEIGRLDVMTFDKDRVDLFHIAVVSAVIAFGAYYFVLFLGGSARLSYLLLSLISLVFGLRLVTATRVLYRLWPDAPHIFLVRGEYASWYFLVGAYYVFLHWLFPRESSRLLRTVFVGLSLVGVTATLVLPASMFTASREFAFLTVAAEVVALVATMTLALIRRRPGAILLGAAFGGTCACVLNDIALYYHWIQSVDLLPISFLMFTLVHAVVIGHRLERQVSEGTLALGEAERRVHVVTENLPIAIFQYAVHARDKHDLLYVSSGVERLFETPREEAVRRLENFRDLAIPEDRPGLDAFIRRAALRDAPAEGTIRIKAPSGHQKSIHIVAQRRRNPEGPLLIEGLLTDVTAQKDMEARLRDLATTDHLTGLFNRRQFLDLSRREVVRAHRFQHPLSVLVIDADHFKTINDRHGHPVGDKVLAAIGRFLRHHVRDVDIVGRLGGEEFGVCLPETTLDSAAQTAERLRAELDGAPIDVGTGAIRVTISIGVVALDGGGDEIATLLARADAAMYAAKRIGRNRVVLAGSPEAEGAGPATPDAPPGGAPTA